MKICSKIAKLQIFSFTFNANFMGISKAKKENVLFPVTLSTLIFWGLLKLYEDFRDIKV